MGRFSHRVAMSVSVSACVPVTVQNTLFRRSWTPLVESRPLDIAMQRPNFSFFFSFLPFNDFGRISFWPTQILAMGMVFGCG